MLGTVSQSATLTLTACSFKNHIVFRDTTGGTGGAIYTNFVDFTAIGCTFENNTATFGGALYLFNGLSSISGCRFEGNVARNADQGGAIYYGGTTTSNAIVSSVFKGNEANEVLQDIRNIRPSTVDVQCTDPSNSFCSAEPSSGPDVSTNNPQDECAGASIGISSTGC